MFKKLALILALPALLLLSGCGADKIDKNMDTANTNEDKKAVERTLATLETNHGEITIKFFNADAPVTVDNFVKLSKEGFYDGTKFHRVIKDFMIQGGDPNSRLDDWSLHGRGGPGYTFEDEINEHKLVKGMLAMANSGPNTNGSQFFIVTADSTPWLDGAHTVFGEVISGMDIVEKIENLPANSSDHPLEENEAIITRVVIEN